MNPDINGRLFAAFVLSVVMIGLAETITVSYLLSFEN